MTTNDASRIVADYFDRWRAGDFDGVRALVADDVSFVGPLATLDNADDYVAGLAGMAKVMTDMVIRHVFVSGVDVLTWYDMHTTVAPPVPVANWCHVDNGKITALRVAFDPRGMLGLLPAEN